MSERARAMLVARDVLGLIEADPLSRMPYPDEVEAVVAKHVPSDDERTRIVSYLRLCAADAERRDAGVLSSMVAMAFTAAASQVESGEYLAVSERLEGQERVLRRDVAVVDGAEGMR